MTIDFGPLIGAIDTTRIECVTPINKQRSPYFYKIILKSGHSVKVLEKDYCRKELLEKLEVVKHEDLTESQVHTYLRDNLSIQVTERNYGFNGECVDIELFLKKECISADSIFTKTDEG